MDYSEFIIKVKQFKDAEKLRIEKQKELLEEFLKLYPFREHPEHIDLLSPEDIYSSGKGTTSFLYWIEFKLSELGRIAVGSNKYAISARDNPGIFKDLLRVTVDDSVSVADKVDAHWEDLKYFGGDKIVAKKIISSYYPDSVIPILKTEDLEHFAELFEIDFRKEAFEICRKSYNLLSTGMRFGCLNNLILQFKAADKELRDLDNVAFMRFLYDGYPPVRIPRLPRGKEPLHPVGMIFEPEFEMEVVYLFCFFHRELGFPYILRMKGDFPDAIVIDENKGIKKIEFEVRSSDFIDHKHDAKGCDIIVCWENDTETRKDLPEIISIKDFMKGL